MIGLDTNILIPLLVSSHPSHHDIVSRMNTLNERFAITHVNIAECLRLLSHTRVFQKPLSLKNAVEALAAFVEAYQVIVLEQDSQWWLQLSTVAEKEIFGLKGNEIFDAQIALCLRYNGIKTIWTYDSDFKKYSFLKVV